MLRLTLTLMLLALTLYNFYPGILTSDSLFQLVLSTNFKFNDWHPPMMSVNWYFMNRIFGYPSGLLVFQSVILWIAIFIYSKLYSSKFYCFLIYLIPFYPWVLNFEGVIWKDIQMAYSIVLATIILFMYKHLKLGYFLTLIFIVYAVGVRHNAIIAILPIFYFFLIEIKIAKLRALTYSFSLCIFLYILNRFITYNILNSEHSNILNYIFIDDLTYFSVHYGVSLLPGVPLEVIEKCSKFVVGGTTLIAKDFCYTPIYKLHNLLYASSLFSDWFNVVLQNPLLYLKFRFEVFVEFLRLPNLDPYYFWIDATDPNTLGITFKKNWLFNITSTYIEYVSSLAPFLFKPYFWFFNSLLDIFIIFRFVMKNKNLLYSLCFSSIFYVLSFFPFMNMYDFRYAYFQVISITLINSILLFNFFSSINSSLYLKNKFSKCK